jgi:putative transposase
MRLQINRQGFEVARCTIEMLMKSMRLQDAIRSKPPQTTVSD